MAVSLDVWIQEYFCEYFDLDVLYCSQDGNSQKLYLTLTLRTNYKAITVIYHELNDKPPNCRTLYPWKRQRKLSLVPLNWRGGGKQYAPQLQNSATLKHLRGIKSPTDEEIYVCRGTFTIRSVRQKRRHSSWWRTYSWCQREHFFSLLSACIYYRWPLIPLSLSPPHTHKQKLTFGGASSWQ